jgi:HAD superfamily hydrolase (TIGR01509 family)
VAETKLVIFDCDGVLVDSELLANEVFAEYLNANGLVMPLDEVMERFIGLSLKTCAQITLEDYGVRLPDDFIPEIRRLTEIALADDVKGLPSVREAVERLALPVCVGSSGEHSKMTLTLTTSGLFDLFEGRLFSATEVENGKPAPDLFLYAARKMGFNPENCLVVEDSPYGIQGAVAAGMRAIGFCGGGHRDLMRDSPMLVEAGAEIVIDDMARLPGVVTLG